ncbi:Leucine-rich repeat-containing protein 3 [Merluccius polli]|uniref:Leucine-rich repeat-containing protein 3 n=1 Tax=Merluccius polli TaxID=89951 RepID=A0AA47MVM9_MERPO|nr:Leucine-rich repeat-containing protein 3 [Merluccius polli]
MNLHLRGRLNGCDGWSEERRDGGGGGASRTGWTGGGRVRPSAPSSSSWLLCTFLLSSAAWRPLAADTAADAGDDDPCPEKCRCDWDTATVWCADAGLAEVPAGLPPATAALHLERNHIQVLPEAAFAELRHLRDLYLSHNRIETLASGALRHLGPELRLLDLSHNQLRRAGRRDFGATRAKTRLFHNPWHCDCALQELMETLHLEPETVNGITCDTSEEEVEEVEEVEEEEGGEGSRWEEPSQGAHAGQPLVKLLDSGVNFCSVQRKTTDVAMLVTMFAWFSVVIVYVVYYVRQNQAEARRHLEYLKSLPSPKKVPTETDTLSTGF